MKGAARIHQPWISEAWILTQIPVRQLLFENDYIKWIHHMNCKPENGSVLEQQPQNGGHEDQRQLDCDPESVSSFKSGFWPQTAVILL